MSYLTEGDVGRGLLRIAAPIVAGNILQSILELVDLYFVGRLGTEAIAGVAMSGTIIWVLMTLIIGLNTATTAFVSRFFGARDMRGVGRAIVHALILGLGFSLLLSTIGILFAEDMLLLLGAETEVAQYGAAYLSILLLGIVTLVELWILVSSFQSCGDSLTPMLIMILANLINMVLDPLLIFGIGGFPALGVAGAAVATISSRAIGFAIALVIIIRRNMLHEFIKQPRLDTFLIWRLLRVAIPNSIQSGFRSITFLAMLSIVALYGTAAISAYGIAGRMDLVALMPGFGIATATAVIVGQNLGADKPQRAEEGVKLSLLLYGSFMAIVAILYYLLAEEIMAFFDPSGSSTVIGSTYFHYYAPFYVLLSATIILSFALNGAGDTRRPMYATLISMVIIQIPLAYYLPGILGIGIEGVWLAMDIGLIVQTGLLAWMFHTGEWKRTAI